MSLIRNIYGTVAFLALVNLAGIGGIVGYLISSDKLDAEKAREIIKLVNGTEDENEQADPGMEDENDDPTDETIETQVASSREQTRVSEEITRRDTDRYRTQLEQRLKFIRRERIEIDRLREEFDHDQMRAKENAQESLERQQTAGFAKELEILRSLKPQAALTQIMTMDDAQAAELLFKLGTRKIKKIFEAAKTEAQLKKITTIRELIRDVKTEDALVGGRQS